MARSPCLTFAFGLLVVCGCSGDDGSNGDAGIDAISPSCREAMDHSDLTWLQDRVFQPSCAGFTACHMGTAPDAGGLSLERGQTHRQLVDVDSMMFDQFKRVEPNDPANSYLMIIMGQYPGPLDVDVGRMPYNSPLLCKEKRDAVERWILAGALDEGT
jgi:hypothetical protein